VFSLRITELPMPTGSRNPEVLLDWLMESMGLVRRRKDQTDGHTNVSPLHRMMMHTFLADPLRGWDSKAIGNETGMSNTGLHHHIVRLRESGLISSKVDGKWHRYVLRGGSISAATSLASIEAKAILEIRLEEMSSIICDSKSRMGTPSEEEVPLSIRISEPGPRGEGPDSIGRLVDDLGLSGDNPREGETLPSRLLSSLGSSETPVTVMALSERLSESRGRVQTVIQRMRKAGLVDRVPMLERIPQDIFTGIMRQLDARGEEWLLSKGGLGRLETGVQEALLEASKDGTLEIEGVRRIISEVPLQDQKILVNTLGGRTPLGVRISGSDHSQVSQRVMRRVDRSLRRINTVAQRLQESLEGL